MGADQSCSQGDALGSREREPTAWSSSLWWLVQVSLFVPYKTFLYPKAGSKSELVLLDATTDKT